MIEPQVRSAINLWYTKGLDILDDIEESKWKLSIHDFTDLFTYHFMPHNIVFNVKSTPQNIREYVDSATFFEDAGIEIFLRPETIKYLKKIRFSKEDYMLRWIDPRKNMFVEELIQVLSHELLHRKQWELGMEDDPRDSYGKEDWEYLSVHTEIQTHAQDTARCIVYCKSKTWQRFYVDMYRHVFGNDSPEFKKFMTWIYKFVETMRKGQTGLLP